MLKITKMISSSLLVASLGLGGCTGVGGLANVIQAPKVSVQNVVLQDISMTQGNAVVSLNITNPNPVAVPLEGVQYNLRLNGRSVASGDQRQSMSLKPNQPLLVNIPVQLQFNELMQLAPTLLSSRQVQYDVEGAVRLPFVSVPFQRQGGVGL